MKKWSLLLATLFVVTTIFIQKGNAVEQSDLFYDIPEGHWVYVPAINAYIDGIITGYEDGSFGMGKNIPREEAAVIIDRIDGLFSQRLEVLDGIPIDASVLSPFSDVLENQWYSESIQSIFDKKIITGYENGTYGVGKFINRCEAAVIVKRNQEYILGMIKKKYGQSVEVKGSLPSTPSFKDVTPEVFCYEAVENLRQQGIITGYPDQTYRPGEYLTREEFITLQDKNNKMLIQKINGINNQKGRVAFVTSVALNGNIGGVKTADNICQVLANEAGLGDNFLAWLSTDSESPNTRFDKDGGPFITTHDTTIAENWNDLTDGTIQNAIKYDENGIDVSLKQKKYKVIEANAPIRFPVDLSEELKSLEELIGLDGLKLYDEPINRAWTATNASGKSLFEEYIPQYDNVPKDCNGWSSSSGQTQGGDITQINEQWSYSGDDTHFSCSEPNRLYCFEQGEVEEKPAEKTGFEKTAFFTSTEYNGNLGGVFGADAICQSHAEAGGLSGEYFAYLEPWSWYEASNHETDPKVDEREDILYDHQYGRNDKDMSYYDENNELINLSGYIYLNASGEKLGEGMSSYSTFTAMPTGIYSNEYLSDSNKQYYNMLYKNEFGNIINENDRIYWTGMGYANHTCHNWTNGEETPQIIVNGEVIGTEKDNYGSLYGNEQVIDDRESVQYSNWLLCKEKARLLCIEK